MSKSITKEYLDTLFRYSFDDGILTWAVKRRGTKGIGNEAGSLRKNGYVQINIDGKLYFAHRLIWMLATGEWPKKELDHINGVRSDNRLENLREADAFQNHQNQKRPSNNKSGTKGVCWNVSSGKWSCFVAINGKSKYWGSFTLKEDAEARVKSVRESIHGEFANHG
jgi:hypothetical protein